MKTSPTTTLAAVVVLASAWASSAATLRHASRSLVNTDLQPEVVAKILSNVQDEWISQAATFADCTTRLGEAKNCKDSQQSFGRSCSKVVDGIVQGSSGDQNRVREYMNLVCAQKSLTTVHHNHCLGLQQMIDGALQYNEYSNRMHFKSDDVCNKYWSTFADAEQKRAQAERAAQKEMLIKANELANKKRLEAEQKKQRDEADKKKFEAQRVAKEAKERAAKARKDAAEGLARKKAMAKAALKEAQERVAAAAFEAARAAQEHKEMQLEHEKAEEHLRNITMAHKAHTENSTNASVASTASLQNGQQAQNVVHFKINTVEAKHSLAAEAHADATKEKIVKQVVKEDVKKKDGIVKHIVKEDIKKKI